MAQHNVIRAQPGSLAGAHEARAHAAARRGWRMMSAAGDVGEKGRGEASCGARNELEERAGGRGAIEGEGQMARARERG